MRKIPKGRASTYQEVARRAGSPKAYRAVGNALNKNPFGYDQKACSEQNQRACPEQGRRVPCHRVVKSDGLIGGFASGCKNKIKLLKREGIVFEKGKIDLKKFGWKIS